MNHRLFPLLATASVVCVGGLVYLGRADDTPVKTTYERPGSTEKHAPAMVPWRTPDADTHQFFPGATAPDASNPRIVALSQHRAALTKALGPETPLASNALYVYPVDGHGAVLLRRVSGAFGGIEVVVGVNNEKKVVGVRLQRHREPPDIASYIESADFLGSFANKTATSAFPTNPKLPSALHMSAEAISRAVRSLLIEYDAGTRG